MKPGDLIFVEDLLVWLNSSGTKHFFVTGPIIVLDLSNPDDFFTKILSGQGIGIANNDLLTKRMIDETR